MSAALGRRLRDSGMQQVLAFSEPEWKEDYRWQVAHWFEARARGYVFTGEKLREIARQRGVAEPGHFNAWSAMAASMIKTWRNAGLLEVIGMTPALSPATHAHGLKQYRKN